MLGITIPSCFLPALIERGGGGAARGISSISESESSLVVLFASHCTMEVSSFG